MKINQKQVRNSLIVAILIAVLCASSYYYGVSSSYVGTTSEVWVNPPFSEASYVVGQYNSTYYYAENCTTGKYDFGNVAVSGGYVSSNASYVFQSCINILISYRGGTIYTKNGIYTVTNGLTITYPSGGSTIHIVGEGAGSSGATANATVIIFTGDKFLDITNNAWTSVPELLLENLYIRHYTKNNNSICLDLTYCQPILRNIRLSNINGTRQGTAIRTGGAACPGKTVSWYDVTVTDFGVGYYLSLDHLALFNTVANSPKYYGFILGFGYFMCLYSPQVFVANNTYTTCRPFYVNGSMDACQIFNPSVEMWSPLTYPIFSKSGIYADRVTIYGIDADSGSTLSSSYAATDFVFVGCRAYTYMTENIGYATVANGEWVSHNLVTTPQCVQITVRTYVYGSPAMPVVVSWVNTNATMFQVTVYWTNGTAITTDAINISWYARVQ